MAKISTVDKIFIVHDNYLTSIKRLTVSKQMFRVFLFNIENYSPDVINIQRHKAQLNIILMRVNNFNIKQKEVWNICFIIRHQLGK